MLVSGNLGSLGKKSPHTDIWAGRVEEVTWILCGVGSSPRWSLLVLPLWNPGVFRVERRFTVLTPSLFSGELCPREMGPFVRTLDGH